MLKYLLVPSLRQWRSWSLPSKATLASLWVGILGIFVTFSLHFLQNDIENQGVSERFYNLEDMRSRLPGFNEAYLASMEDFERKVDQIRENHPASRRDDWRYTFELKVLGYESGGIDLNGDGIPELYFDFPLACGTGGCTNDILSFNPRTESMEYIGQFSTRQFQILGNPINGWAAIKETWRMGACEQKITRYTFRNGEYRPESSYLEKNC